MGCSIVITSSRVVCGRLQRQHRRHVRTSTSASDSLVLLHVRHSHASSLPVIMVSPPRTDHRRRSTHLTVNSEGAHVLLWFLIHSSDLKLTSSRLHSLLMLLSHAHSTRLTPENLLEAGADRERAEQRRRVATPTGLSTSLLLAAEQMIRKRGSSTSTSRAGSPTVGYAAGATGTVNVDHLFHLPERRILTDETICHPLAPGTLRADMSQLGVTRSMEGKKRAKAGLGPSL